MPRILNEDESGLPTTSHPSPAQRLSAYLQDTWTILNPAEANILWESYWMGKGLMSIFFREYNTRVDPMVLGWGKWSYFSDIGIIISAWYERNGDYSTVVTNARTHIENLIQTDVRAMKNYGISAMRITDINTNPDYPKKGTFADDVCDLEIRVQFISSKTVIVT